jgi:hypothetical protein
MGLQLTASKVEDLLHCARPFAEGVEKDPDEPSEAQRYGSAFHTCMQARAETHAKGADIPLEDFAIAAIGEKYGVEIDPAHVVAAWAALGGFLRGANEWGVPFRIASVERPLATTIRYYRKGRISVTSRPCGFDPETHTYDLRSGEFGGTYDLLLESPSGLKVVLDFKTGDWGTFHSPAELPQLLTLALQTGAEGVAVLHTPREAPPIMYTATLDPEALPTFARRLRAARKRIGDGSLTPGEHCSRCHARSSCPSQDGLLLVRATSLVRAANATLEGPTVSLGAMHMMLGEFDRLARRAREQLRERVRAGEIIQRPDGKILVMREKTVEGLSKSSVIAALGKVKGEAELTRLRKSGCITSSTRDEMHAVDDK